MTTLGSVWAESGKGWMSRTSPYSARSSSMSPIFRALRADGHAGRLAVACSSAHMSHFSVIVCLHELRGAVGAGLHAGLAADAVIGGDGNDAGLLVLWWAPVGHTSTQAGVSQWPQE